MSNGVMALLLAGLITSNLLSHGALVRFPSFTGTDLPAQASPARWTRERGIIALDQAQKDLRNAFVVASVAARPGEEDSSTLVYCRKKLGAHTTAVFASRAEDGDDQDIPASREPAGVARTSQALQVAGAEGADLYFLNLPDQPAEQPVEDVAAAWEKKDGLLSMVRFIRAHHPDVIVSGAETKSSEGAAAATIRLVTRGIESAADASQFPESGRAWSVKRLYLRGTEGDHNAEINAGEFDLMRGQTYARMADAARRAYPVALQHESAERIYYKQARPVDAAPADGGSSILSGLTLPKDLDEALSPPTISPGGTGEADRLQLAQVLMGRLYIIRSGGQDDELRERFGPEYFRVARFISTLERLIGLALGLDLEMQLSDGAVVPGQKLAVKLRFTNGTDHELPVEFQTPAALPLAALPPAGGASTGLKTDLTNAPAWRSITKDYEYQVPPQAALTVPHSAHLYESSFFPVGEGGWPTSSPFGLTFPAAARVSVGVVNIVLRTAAMVDIVPAFELSAAPPTALLKDFDTARNIDFTVRIVNHTPGPFTGELWVVPLAVAKDDYEPIQVKFSREDEEADVGLILKAPILKPPLATAILLEFRRPRPEPPAALASFKIDVRAVGLAVSDNLKVGYICAAGQSNSSSIDSSLALALDQLGCKHELLRMDNLRFADGAMDLRRLDTIIIDRDAYHDVPELIRLNDKLLAYARAGGNLVVMPQSAAAWNAVAGLAPFPIRLSTQYVRPQMNMARIAEDGAAVLKQPNKIEPGDLTAWPAGRRICIPESWDNHYKSLIAYGPADSNQPSSLLLFAKSGEGTYVYLGIPFDEAIAGMYPAAYKLLSNLLTRESSGTVSAPGGVNQARFSSNKSTQVPGLRDRGRSIVPLIWIKT